MMNAEAIQTLQRSEQKPQVVQVDGLELLYTPTNEWFKEDLPYRERAVEPLRLATLAAVVEVARMQIMEVDCFHVASHAEVRLLGKLRDGRRHAYAIAAAEPAYGDGSWRPGAFVGLEETIVALQTRFEKNANRDALLSLFSRIRDDNVRTFDDDGLTQVVTVRQGAALAQDAKVPSPIILFPFRTFREVEQPASPFIVRLRSGKSGEGPTVAVFEADGGRWKLDAIEAVRTHLAEISENILRIVA